MAVTTLNSSSPSGTGAAVTQGSLGAAAEGDLIIAFAGWARSGVGLTVSWSDTKGNTWTPIALDSNASEAGGYAYCIVGTGKSWGAGGNSVTATISTGTPGGRVIWVGKIAAADFDATTPIQAHVESAALDTLTPSLSSGSLTADAVMVALDLCRQSTGTYSVVWDAPFTEDADLHGSGTTASGISVAEAAGTSGSSYTASLTSSGGTDHHQLGILIVNKPSASTIPLSIGTVASSAAAHGFDFTLTAALAVGTIAAPDSLHGFGLTNSTAVSLGTIPAPDALHGIGMALVLPLSIGTIPAPDALHGIDFTLTRLLDLGTVPAPDALHGLDFTKTTALALGTVAAPDALHGLSFALTRALAIGTISAPDALHGFDMVVEEAVRPTRLVLVHLLDAQLTCAVLCDAIRVRCYDDTVIVEIAEPTLHAHLSELTFRVID